MALEAGFIAKFLSQSQSQAALECHVISWNEIGGLKVVTAQ